MKHFQVEEVGADLQLVKGEQSIVMRTRDAKIVLTIAVSEFSGSLLAILCDKMQQLGLRQITLTALSNCSNSLK